VLKTARFTFATMRRIEKYFLILLSFMLCCMRVSAQQNSANLPSLISNDKTVDQDSLSDVNMLKQKMFVKVITSKHTIFVGEPIMVTYEFYTATNINNQPTVIKQPEFTDWSVKELDFDQGPQFEKINNQNYAIYIIRKVQLIPLQAGTLSLGKSVVNSFVQLLNPVDAYVTKKYTIPISNKDISIEVSDLPQKNKPPNFYGITGVFNISARVDSNSIPVGENGHLIVTITGSGNFDAITKPEIVWPANTDFFEGNDSQHIDQSAFPITAERVFDIPFVGKQEGTIVIASIHFSFFNTDTKLYQTISTDSIQITFTKALDKKQKFDNIVNYDISNRKYLWIVPAIALTVILIGFISYKRNKKTALKKESVATVTEPPVFVQPEQFYRVRYRTDFSIHFGDLESITDTKQFFTKAKYVLTKAVAERIDSTQHSEEILIKELKERTYNAPVCNKVIALYEAFNLNLYAPFETQADLAFYLQELKQAVQQLQAEG
jgi:hypothetical protein